LQQVLVVVIEHRNQYFITIGTDFQFLIVKTKVVAVVYSSFFTLLVLWALVCCSWWWCGGGSVGIRVLLVETISSAKAGNRFQNYKLAGRRRK
jgi:hypothetical protein